MFENYVVSLLTVNAILNGIVAFLMAKLIKMCK